MKHLTKKILLLCGIILATSFVYNFMTPSPVSADCRYFLGMTSWDCNIVEQVISDDQLKNNIWTIAANIATDITVIAAYLIIGYVIYGGYLYTFSGGDPGKVATGKKAITQAFIGLAIVMSANVILNSIRIALGANFTKNCTIAGECYGLDTDTNAAGAMILGTIRWVVGIAGVVSAIFVVYGGISYTTSAGDPGKLKKAKDMITYALIGLAIVALAEIITAFVSNIIREANQVSLITTTKEYYENQKNS